MTWTEELVDELRSHWLAGMSASEIAAALGLGLSRNSIIGKLHRIGLTDISRPQAIRRGAIPRHERHAPNPRPPKPKARKAMSSAPPSKSLNLRLVDLAPHGCRWPVKMVGGEHLFCGQPAPEGASYCDGCVTEHRPFQTPASYHGQAIRPEWHRIHNQHERAA